MSAANVPTAEHAERAVLACCVIDPSYISEVASLVDPPEFELEKHRLIFEVLVEMDRDARPVDLRTVLAALTERGTVDRAGGMAYVVGLDEDLPALGNLPEYAREVRSRATSRQVLGLLAQASTRLGATGDPEQARHYLAESLRALDRTVTTQVAPTFADRLAAAAARLSTPTRQRGVRTGFWSLDAELVAMAPGELVVVGGYAGTGKSTFCEQIAVTAARDGRTVVFCSLEMSLEQLEDRAFARALGVALRSLRAGDISGARIEDTRAALAAEEWPRRLVAMRPTTTELRAIETEIRAVCRERPADLVIVDHLHRIQVREARGDRRREVGAAARALKELARDLGVPVIAAAQVARSAVVGSDRPRSWHLKESGDVEAEADTIVMLDRQEDALLTAYLEKVRQGESGARAHLAFDQRTRELVEASP